MAANQGDRASEHYHRGGKVEQARHRDACQVLEHTM